jgi:cation diffusion facilitator CzcD-associated flavoprotein CzcO
MGKHIPLLIVGAGPFGLAMSAYAGRCNIEHAVVGHTMEFWKLNMPKGMYLRSGCDWHYDPFNEDTIERYLETKNLRPAIASGSSGKRVSTSFPGVCGDSTMPTTRHRSSRQCCKAAER